MQNGFRMPRNLFKLKIRQLSLNAETEFLSDIEIV
jgi:hypothetical protein